MDATRVYPNWPPVIATTGLAGAVAASDPDSVPFAPQLINDARRRYTGSGVDAYGVMQQHVRNRVGYAYLRAHKRMKLMPAAHHDRPHWESIQSQLVYYLRNYKHFVPTELLKSHIEEVFRPDQDATHNPKWQGNALAGACSDAGDHIVFFPTGEVLQQACAFYKSSDPDGRSVTSNKVETGTAIRQFAVMGRSVAYQPIAAQEIFVAARGSANCTILQAPMHPGAKMKAKLKLTFSDMLYNVAASPHAEAELAFVTADGVLHWWEPESGLQTMHLESAMTSERLLRCEYSSHPCVLWTANRFTVRSVDLREKAKPLTQYEKLFDLASVGSPLAEIYDIKRRASCPFQIVVGSGVSIEIVDSRMPTQPLLSWSQPATGGSTQSTFGVIEEVDLSTKTNEARGAIVSTCQQSKVATLYPFERCRKGDKSNSFSISSLRSIHDDAGIKHTSISQYVVSDAPLDLQLMDGDEWSVLLGICALPMPPTAKRGSAAAIYQVNNLGDLFSQEIHAKGRETPYDAGVQVDLPCGVTGLSASDSMTRKRLPLPIESILPEHDSSSIAAFVPVALKAMRRKYPRLSSVHESRVDTDPEPSMDEARLVTTLLAVCRPSATLFRLHRYVNDAMRFPISAQDLLAFLRSRPEFRIRNVYTPVRQKLMHVLNPHGSDERPIHEHGDDPRIAVCRCCPKTTRTPCESLSCVVPHVLVISSANGLRLDEIFPQRERRRKSTSEYAETIAEAREAYGTDGL